MPKKGMDYSNCIIYKIICNDLCITDCYVGHTTNFKQRKNCHRIACNYNGNRSFNYKLYQTMRNNGGRDNWTMVEIEKFPCNDFYEASARERYWYEILNANLNMCVPIISNEEKIENQKKWCDNNKEIIKEKSKEYYEANKKEILQKQKIKNDGKKIIKEKKPPNCKKETCREWKEKNKERLNETIYCECGGKYKIHHKTHHIKTKLHQTFISC